VVRPELAEEPLRRYSTARLAAVLDARSFVESRTSAGGTAAARRRELAAEAAADIDVHRRTVGALIDGVEQASRGLIADARDLVGRLIGY
jgi:argininosuccinate lyase